MDFKNIGDFFSYYSLPSVIIAVVIAIVCFILDKFALKKVSFNIRAYLPFLFGIVLYIIYDLIFVGTRPIFSELTISAGLVTGSLASVFFSVIKRIISGKGLSRMASPLALLIESIILPIVKENKIDCVVVAIEKLLTENEFTSHEQTIDEIVSVLDRHSFENITKDEKLTSARLIITGKNNLDKK